MRVLFLVAAFCLISPGLLAQDEDLTFRKNSLYLEVMGNGILYSLNYERLFSDNTIKPFVRIGGNEMHFDESDTLKFFLVSEAGIAIGRSKNLFDASIGYTHPLTKLYDDRLFFIRAGFRYMGPKGLIIRFSPMYAINTLKGDVFSGLWFGVAAGYSF